MPACALKMLIFVHSNHCLTTVDEGSGDIFPAVMLLWWARFNLSQVK